jgi:AbiV
VAPFQRGLRRLILDELWTSHDKKLEAVYRFLEEEPYWFDVRPPDPGENAAVLGTIKSWSRRYSRSKERGFYVDLSKTGDVMVPSDIADGAALREVIARVHQIGWQLRLGEHIEGKYQDEREAGSPPMIDEDLAWLDGIHGTNDIEDLRDDLLRSLKEGRPGEPIPNAAYRFNPPGAERSPFRNFGKPGYEAETRELMRLARGDHGDSE